MPAECLGLEHHCPTRQYDAAGGSISSTMSECGEIAGTDRPSIEAVGVGVPPGTFALGYRVIAPPAYFVDHEWLRTACIRLLLANKATECTQHRTSEVVILLASFTCCTAISEGRATELISTHLTQTGSSTLPGTPRREHTTCTNAGEFFDCGTARHHAS